MKDCFEHGYTKALFDVRAYIEGYAWYIRNSRLFNESGILKIMDALIENRVEMRETGTVYLGYNPDTKQFFNMNNRKDGSNAKMQ